MHLHVQIVLARLAAILLTQSQSCRLNAARALTASEMPRTLPPTLRRLAAAAPRRHLSSVSPAPVDILVVGGGLVGASFAAAVSSDPRSASLSVALVDPSPPAPSAATPPPPPSLRTSTVSPSSAAFLSAAGVWPALPPARAAPFEDMLVWERPGAGAGGKIRFSGRDAPGAGPELGFVVDNDSLRAAAFDRLRELAETVDTRVVRAQVSAVDYAADRGGGEDAGTAAGGAVVPWPVVRLDNGDTLAARLVVVADGARSRVRSMASFDWFSHAYEQAAVVANVALDRPTATAYQRFLSTGPVALLPLAPAADGTPVANVVWSTTPAEAAALSAADDVVFLDEVNAALREREDAPVSAGAGAAQVVVDATAADAYDNAPEGLPRAKAVLGARGSFPLSAGHAPKYVCAERRTVLLGDAAHSVHPLAGQGANMGFADAASLARAVAVAAAAGRDVGGEAGAPLARYERDRVAANVAMMGTLHALQAVFGASRMPGFGALRRAGVSALDAVAPAKKLILKVMS